MNLQVLFYSADFIQRRFVS